MQIYHGVGLANPTEDKTERVLNDVHSDGQIRETHTEPTCTIGTAQQGNGTIPW